MQYRILGKSDLNVSVVGLGTWAMGNDFWGASDDAASISAIQTALDQGINLIDTAPWEAGSSQEGIRTGRNLKKGITATGSIAFTRNRHGAGSGICYPHSGK